MRAATRGGRWSNGRPTVGIGKAAVGNRVAKILSSHPSQASCKPRERPACSMAIEAKVAAMPEQAATSSVQPISTDGHMEMVEARETGSAEQSVRAERIHVDCSFESGTKVRGEPKRDARREAKRETKREAWAAGDSTHEEGMALSHEIKVPCSIMPSGWRAYLQPPVRFACVLSAAASSREALQECSPCLCQARSGRGGERQKEGRSEEQWKAQSRSRTLNRKPGLRVRPVQ
ncbi:MAG: hypothetical protein SGPRY_001620 [Prymnesium sp.]